VSIGVEEITNMMKRALHSAILVGAVALAGCDTNPFDRSQVPTITVTPVVAAPLVTIAWEPAGAALVRVYRGTATGQGYSDALVWSVAATSGNALTGPIEYGATVIPGGVVDVRAKAIVPGEPYTVEVTRADPKGKGDGFTATGNRYVATRTFTLAVLVPAP
jgi:hypothetical protein